MEVLKRIKIMVPISSWKDPLRTIVHHFLFKLFKNFLQDSPNAHEGHEVGEEITVVESNLQTKATGPSMEVAVGEGEVDEDKESLEGAKLQPDVIDSAALVTTKEAPLDGNKKLTSD